MMSDWELLQAYAKHRSETAFAELVRRHIDWVHSAARRQVNDPQLAQDVTQAVFVLLARKAGTLRAGTILTGWLFRTTRFVAARARRTEQRRKAREESVSAMSPTAILPDDNETIWNQLAPHLDQAVAALSEPDRRAILLRFYEKKSLLEVGTHFGISEDAAKKRVSRAIEKLRAFLTRRGVGLTAGAAGLAALLTAKTVQAAPATLAATVAKTSLAAASASAIPLPLVRQTLHVWRWAKLKLAAAIAAASVAAVVLIVGLDLESAHNATPAQPSPASTGAVTAATLVANAQPMPPPASDATTTNPAVTGRVIDLHVVQAQTNLPLAGVRIGVEGDNQKADGHTDAGGYYQIKLPDKDLTRLSVTAHQDGYVPMRVEWGTHGGTYSLPKEFTFALEPATSIGGLVRDEQGNPIAGATVHMILRLFTFGRSEELRIDTRAFHKIITDALGRWRLDQAPADLSDLSIRVTHPDYQDAAYPDITKLSEKKLRDMTAVMVMEKGTAIDGVVLDQQGKPIAGASVGLGKSRGDVAFDATTTDAAGSFHFDNATAGESWLTVQAEGYAPELQHIEVGKQAGPVQFFLGPGHVVHGWVVDTQHNPLPDVGVAADIWRGLQTLGWRVMTGPDGSFNWTNAPADDVQFSFWKDGYRRVDHHPMHPDTEGEVITLPPPFVARGSVTDAATGKPIPSFTITPGQLFEGQLEPSWTQPNQEKFADGRYQFEVKFSGRYVLRADAEGYAPGISPAFDQTGDGFAYDFKLSRAAWIQGVVRTVDGQPVFNAEVLLINTNRLLAISNGHMQGNRGDYQTYTDATGRFQFTPVNGPFSILALDDGGYAQSSAQQTVAVPDIVIQPWARIEGVMRIGNRPAQGMKVQACGTYALLNGRRIPFFSADAMTDQAGHFEIDHVPIGDVVVGRSICLNQKTITIGTTHFVQLRTEPGQTAHADIGGTGQPVVGRLVAPAGFNQTLDWTMSQAEVHTKASEGFQPPANWATMTDAQRKDLVAQWRAAHPSPNGGHQFREFYPFPIQEDGFFRVEDVPPGEYALTVTVHEPPVAGSFNLGKPMATVRREFTVPELSGGRSDLPLDLGELLIEPTPQQR